MNARRLLLILGIIALVLIGAVVTVAIVLHKKMESEKNRTRTQAARTAPRKPKDQEPDSTNEVETQQTGSEEILKVEDDTN